MFENNSSTVVARNMCRFFSAIQLKHLLDLVSKNLFTCARIFCLKYGHSIYVQESLIAQFVQCLLIYLFLKSDIIYQQSPTITQSSRYCTRHLVWVVNDYTDANFFAKSKNFPKSVFKEAVSRDFRPLFFS